MTHRWTAEPGRHIHFDGQPFVHIDREKEALPVEADALVHFIVKCLNSAGTTPDTLYTGAMGFPPRQGKGAREEARRSPSLPVIFRAEKSGDHKGEVTAVFPTLPGTGPNDFTVYAHIGQHSTGTHEWYVQTRAATPAEYAPLLAELRRIYEQDPHEPVRLHVVERFTRHHDDERRKSVATVRETDDERRYSMTFGELPPFKQFSHDVSTRIDPESSDNRVYWPKGTMYPMELVSQNEIELAEEFGGLEEFEPERRRTGRHSGVRGFRGNQRQIYDFLVFLMNHDAAYNGEEDSPGMLASSIMTTLGYEWI